MKTITIIGANGFIGKYMYKYFRSKLKDLFFIKGTCYSEKTNKELKFLDVTDKKNLEKFFIQNKSDFIIWLSGAKDVKLCEKDYEYAYKLNTEPIANAIQIMTHRNIKSQLIFFSSDYVFDGRKGQYKDTDEPNPKTNYGKTKYLTEQLLLNSNINYRIIRTCAVMAKGSVFFDWILHELRNKKEINVFANIFFSPTPMQFLNDMLAKIILNDNELKQKIIHISGGKRLSRFEFVKLISNFIKEPHALVSPENIDFNKSTFQKDLSLIPSDFVKLNKKHSFEDYIEQEIKNDKKN
ncbi:hypothetical protein ES703_117690 [subsurface metagenome]